MKKKQIKEKIDNGEQQKKESFRYSNNLIKQILRETTQDSNTDPKKEKPSIDEGKEMKEKESLISSKASLKDQKLKEVNRELQQAKDSKKDFKKETTKEQLKEPIKETIKESIKEPIKESMKEPMKESIKEPTKEPMKEPMKEPIKEPLKEFIKELMKGQREEPFKESAKESAKKISKEPLKPKEPIKNVSNDQITQKSMKDTIKPQQKPALKRKRLDLEEEREVMGPKLSYEAADDLDDIKIGKKKKLNDGEPLLETKKLQSDDLFDIFDSIDTYGLGGGNNPNLNESSMEEENSDKDSVKSKKNLTMNEEIKEILPVINNENVNFKMVTNNFNTAIQNITKANEKNIDLPIIETNKQNIVKVNTLKTNNDNSKTNNLKSNNDNLANINYNNNSLNKVGKPNIGSGKKQIEKSGEKKNSSKKQETKDDKSSLNNSRDGTLDDLFKIKPKKTSEENKETKDTLLKNLLKQDKKEINLHIPIPARNENIEKIPKFIEKKPINENIYDKKYQIDENGFFQKNGEINKFACPFSKLNYGNFQKHKAKRIKRIVYQEKKEHKSDFSHKVYALIEWENQDKNGKIQDSFHPIDMVIKNSATLLCDYIISHEVFEKKIYANRFGTKIFSVKAS